MGLGSAVSLAFGFVVLAVSLGACEYPGIAHPLASSEDVESPLAPPSNASEAASSSADEEQPTSSTAEGPVEMILKDFHLDPKQLTVKAGTITFILSNGGRYTHDFRIEGHGVDEGTPKIAVGRDFRWEITLEPGEYRISCPISNHDERGMVGILTVVE